MTSSASRYTRKTLVSVAALLLVGLLTTASPSLAENDCGAEIVSPYQGQATVTTQVLSTSVSTGGTFQGVVVSTTGEIEVEIDHECIPNLALFVYKVEADGTLTEIHHNEWRYGEEPCYGDKFGQTQVDEVSIGLDAGEFVFEVGWLDCKGNPGGDLSEDYVFDPPLPVPQPRKDPLQL